ncbi:MAG TPA: MarR family transcriptional regulator [Candidatus Dormibacteraeota bacterium]|nr:MarR family transcriptional regulator [Candidatus Dormibacteraeota bacterium]
MNAPPRPADDHSSAPAAAGSCSVVIPIPDEMLEACVSLPGFDKLAIQTVLALKTTAHQMETCAGEWFDEYGLTPAKFNALLVLRARGDQPMRLSEIGNFLFSTRANVTGLIDGLERDGLVQRTANPGDRRSTLVTLTEKGSRLMADVLPKHFTRVRRIVAVLSPEERRQLVDLLAKLFTAFEDLNAADSKGEAC